MSENLEFSKELEVKETNIPGLLVFDLPVHGDNRGWFKENWQREKMIALGLPDFGPVQNNISFNAEAGVTRGLHAEPWDKYISVANGRVFGAWVDLREGDSFGKTCTVEIDATKAVYVPRGIANSFQALEDNTAYTYLVNDHWYPEAKYTSINLADETAAINWPIPLESAELSDKDKAHPRLGEVEPIKPRKTFVVGANGQLGNALREILPSDTTTFVDRDEFDMTDPNAYDKVAWREYEAIINAAAYTAVDTAETAEGREFAWSINAQAVKLLAGTAIKHGLTLVHVSSDYVFDGEKAPHDEEEAFNPLSVYGQTKAAGDIAAQLVPKHYLVRTSWVVGKGDNFVKTMHGLAQKGIQPSVVNDQLGRLTFTEDLAKGMIHLLNNRCEYGTYNLTNDGQVTSWTDIAKRVYELSGYSSEDVSGVSTADYYADKENIALRPLKSELDLSKIKSTGFELRNWNDVLEDYIVELKEES